MAEPIENIYPFGGDPPDRLYDETSEVLKAWTEKFAPLVAECAAEGITVQVLFGCYDPLTGMTHNDSLGKGDRNARLGMAASYIKDSLE